MSRLLERLDALTKTDKIIWIILWMLIAQSLLLIAIFDMVKRISP